MFDGKMLRGLTGTPMRSRLRANSSFADAEPEPLTLANLMTKSLTASIRGAVPALTLLVMSARAPSWVRHCGSRCRRAFATR